MRNLVAAAPAASLAFAAIILAAAFAASVGFMPEETIRLWAGVMAAGDGEYSVGRIVAAYPTIPFLVTTALELIVPAGTPTPALVAAIVTSLLVAVWFIDFRRAGISTLPALAATILLGLHPMLLRAALAGPAEVFFAAFLFMLANGLYAMRARTTAPEVMTVGLALLGLSFSHPMGAAVTLAAVPFLMLAVRPALVASAAPNVLAAVIFPVLFCVGAFAYVSWVFPGSGWTFLTSPTTSLSHWAAAWSRLSDSGITGLLALDAGFALIIALALGAPLAIVALVRIRRRLPLVAPALVFVAAVVTAAMMTGATGWFGDPSLGAAAAPVLAATLIVRVPGLAEGRRALIALLAFGWIGGAVGLVIADPRMPTLISDAVHGSVSDSERLDALKLGGAIHDLSGVLIDTGNAPAVVLGRGHADGLLMPQSERFEFALLFARIDAPYVAVPDPNPPAGALDRLNKAFPQLYQRGAAGYRLVYQNPTWRLFKRIVAPPLTGPNQRSRYHASD